jgi:uncharacterized membrane protein
MSWKTSLAGVLSVVVAIITFVANPLLDADPATVPQWGPVLAAVTAAVGLLFARDNDKSSEDVGAK